MKKTYRKILILMISVVFVLGITFLPGCGGSKSSGGRNRIAVYQTSGTGGVVGVMPKLIINSNIAYAEGLEIGANQTYILYTPNITHGIEAYVEDDEKRRLPDAVAVAPDFASAGFSECISIQNLIEQPTGGVSFEIKWARPGKCKIVLTGGGLTRVVDVLVWDTEQNFNLDTGVIISETGHLKGQLPANSDIYRDPSGDYYVNGDWRLVETGCTISTWMVKFKAVQEAGTLTGTGPQKINIGDIIVTQCKNGGYAKIVRPPGMAPVFEWCASGQFRDI